jgi:hypothetical protein
MSMHVTFVVLALGYRAAKSIAHAPGRFAQHSQISVPLIQWIEVISVRT